MHKRKRNRRTKRPRNIKSLTWIKIHNGKLIIEDGHKKLDDLLYGWVAK